MIIKIPTAADALRKRQSHNFVCNIKGHTWLDESFIDPATKDKPICNLCKVVLCLTYECLLAARKKRKHCSNECYRGKSRE